MNIIRIDTPDDGRIAAYRDIRERDLVGRQGRFIAEGTVVLDVLLGAARFEAESALVLENRLEGIGPTLAKGPRNLPVYVASRAVMDAIAGFPIHRGVLAVGLRRMEDDLQSFVSSLPQRATILVAVGIANHDNMGAIFRNAAAFGADAVIIDTESCDPLYRKSIRVSVGAALKVPYVGGGAVEDIVATLGREGFRQLALSPSGTTSVRDVTRSDRTALYLGTEGEGLPLPLLSTLETVRIPMAAGFDSLNVAVASAIALHELTG